MEKFMGIMQRAFAIVLIMMLCACMGPRKTEFTLSMDKWIGRSADDLVDTFGIPYGVSEQDSGGRVLEYFKNKKGKAERKQRILPDSGEEARASNQISNDTLQINNDSAGLANRMNQINPANHRKQYDNAQPDQHTVLTSEVQMFCKIRFNVSADNIVLSWSKEGRVCD